LIIRSKNLVAEIILGHAHAIIDEGIIHPPTGKNLCASASWEPHVDCICEAAQCSVGEDDLDDIRELVGLMCCRDSTNGSTIHTDSSFHSDSINQKLNDSFCINLFLSDRIIWREYALFRIAVASVVPNEHVAITPQEKVKPIGVG
jgi:hypothetical protein